MSGGRIVYERDGAVARITIDRPEKKNAFVGTMREELAFALDRATNDPEARAVVLAGSGGDFSAGGDLDYLASLAAAQDLDGLSKLLEAGSTIVRTIRKMEKPVIAAVDGVAAGAGCSLAAACDVVIASDRARFRPLLREDRLRPRLGRHFFLPRRIGHARAFRMASSAEPIDAATALAWGLADRVVPADRFAEVLRAEATRLAATAPTSLGFAKYLIGSEEIPALEDALARETEAQLACFETDDFRKAVGQGRR